MRRLPLLPVEPPTASRVGLALRCVYPWTSGQRAPEREWGVEALVGTAVHLAAEQAIRGEAGPIDMSSLPEDAREKADDLVDVVRNFIGEERERPHHLYDAEVPVELDLLTGAGRVLPSTGPRDYSARIDTGLAGTIDHLLWPVDGLLTMRDWKTGQQRGFANEAARTQTRTLAVATAAIHGVDAVATEIAHITTAGVEIEREVLGDRMLGEHEWALGELGVRLRGGPSAPTPGPWCVEGFCPLLGNCPATKGALAAVVHEVPVFDLFDGDADALHLIDLLPRAKAALAAVEERLKDRIRRNPPTAPDGRRYGYVEQERRAVIVRTPQQFAVLAGVLGEHATAAVEMKSVASIASIQRAARRMLGGGRGVGALRDKALTALAAAGGVKVGRYEKPAWFWPDGVKPAIVAEAVSVDEGYGDDGYDGE